jgi:hypothetical protein
MPVPDFSPGEVLTAAAMDSIGLWLVKTQTVGAGVASVVVTDAFNANFTNYRVIYTGGTCSNDAGMNVTLGASATGYYSGTMLVNYGTGGSSTLFSNNATSWQNAATSLIAGAFMDIELHRPFLAERTAITIVSRPDLRTGGSSSQGSGFHNVAASYTSLTMTPGAGTLTGGTVRVYGFRN